MSADPTRARVVLITHPSEGAREFVHALVGRGLVACVNTVAATSVYRWEGAVEEADEVLLIAKTSVDRLAGLEEFLRDEHPHDVPELVALEPAQVEASYLAWLLDETATGEAER